ncbi:MAG: hypothetical protein K0R31_680, partial [Clostridiales bacterium]|nr:hypothetical protein [Clostridiales bacterium]
MLISVIFLSKQKLPRFNNLGSLDFIGALNRNRTGDLILTMDEVKGIIQITKQSMYADISGFQGFDLYNCKPLQVQITQLQPNWS